MHFKEGHGKFSLRTNMKIMVFNCFLISAGCLGIANLFPNGQFKIWAYWISGIMGVIFLVLVLIVIPRLKKADAKKAEEAKVNTP